MPKRHHTAASPRQKHSTQKPSAREFVADYFAFHRFCKNRNCRRAKRCGGGENPSCVKALWPLMPEDQKMKLRATLAARHAGASVHDAMIAGEAAAARVRLEEAAQGPEHAAYSTANHDGANRL